MYLDNQVFSRSITLKFINQTSQSTKNYLVRYGSVYPGCKYLPMQVKGEFSHSNSITVELNISLEETHICLDIIVTNGNITVSAKGGFFIGKTKNRCKITVFFNNNYLNHLSGNGVSTISNVALFISMTRLALVLVMTLYFCYGKYHHSTVHTDGKYIKLITFIISFYSLPVQCK